MIKKYISTCFVAAALPFFISSCSDFLTEEPYGSATPDSFFKTEEDAIMSGTSCYRQLSNPTDFWAQGLDAVGTIQSDEVFPFLGWTGLLNTYQFDENHETVKGVWKAAYKGISVCNTCLNHVQPMEIKDDVKNQVLAQASFIRAYWYFRLVRLYGGVPLITKDYTSLENLYPSRASVEDVYKLIIDDLTFAAENLPKSWKDTEKGRITKGAAMAQLSLVNLQLKNWAEAEKWAGQVMALEDEGVYELIADFSQIHKETNKNSKESIFEVQYSSEQSKNWRAIYLSPRGVNLSRDSGYGWLQATKEVVKAFEKGDLRFNATFFVPGEKLMIGGNEFEYTAELGTAYGPTPYSIKKGNIYEGDPHICGNNNIIMRYAEVILFRAEALNEMGKTNEAIPLLKRIRDRAGLKTAASYTQEEMRQAIRHERQVEFAFEDVRGWDLIRWGIQKEVLGNIPGSKWQDGKTELWPLPAYVLDENENINEQNPGW